MNATKKGGIQRFPGWLVVQDGLKEPLESHHSSTCHVPDWTLKPEWFFIVDEIRGLQELNDIWIEIFRIMHWRSINMWSFQCCGCWSATEYSKYTAQQHKLELRIDRELKRKMETNGFSACCSVCAATTPTGLHFGAVTCYPCRAFFRWANQ